jgi:hypothetical protein
VKKSRVALLIAAIVALSLTMPAFGAPSLTSLGKRVAKLNKSQARENTFVRRIDVRSDDSGTAEGTAVCPGNSQVTGGGGEWAGDPLPFDIITATIPDGDGWYVAGDSARGEAATLKVYVVCARIGN